MKSFGFVKVAAFLLLSMNVIYSAENLSFIQKQMTAGKASLTGNGYIVNNMIGSGNFTPDLRFPIQLIYNSASDVTGSVGYAWSIPQLESSAVPQTNGVMWTTPWGEKIRFFTKENLTAKDVANAKTEIERNHYFIDEFLDWKAEGLKKKGDWKFTGTRDYEGWEITYADAKLSTVTSPDGNKIELAYMGKQLLSISQNGEAFVKFKYDKNMISEITVNGIRHELSYEDGKVTRLPDTLAGKTTQASRPRLKSIKTGDLAPVEFSYDAQSYLCSIKQGGFTEELAVENETESDRRDYFKAEQERQKARMIGVRSDRLKVSGRLLRDGDFTYSYPKNGKPGNVTLTNKLEQKAEFEYNPVEGSFAITGFNGIRNTIYYYIRHDAAYHGKMYMVMDAQRQIILKHVYNKASGKIQRVTDLAGNEINFAYDKDNNLAEVSRKAADSPKKLPLLRMNCNKDGKPTEIMTMNAEDKAVMTQTIRYDKGNMPVRISNGQTTAAVEYNKFFYPVVVTDSFGLKIRREYDKFNNLSAVIDPFGVRTDYKFTPAGLISSIERKDASKILSSVLVEYNDRGQPVSYTDKDGNVKRFERDPFGRVVKEFFPDETSVEYSYNQLGQLASVLDQNQNEIKFSWDKFGLGAKTTATDQVTEYAYDKFGLLKGVSSWQNFKTDRDIKYEHDKFNRVSKVTYADGEIETFKYDTWGRVIESTRGKKKSTFTYDYFGRLAERIEGALVNTYEYNAYGQRIFRSTANGEFKQTETRGYDEFGRLAWIKSGSDTVFYHYNKQNQLASQVVNGVSIEFEYTKYGQLKKKSMGAN